MTDPTPEPAPEPEGQLYRLSFSATGVVTDSDGNVVNNEEKK